MGCCVPSGRGPGVPVVIELADDHDAVVAALAVARVGGVVTTEDSPDAPVVLVDEGSTVPGGRQRSRPWATTCRSRTWSGA